MMRGERFGDDRLGNGRLAELGRVNCGMNWLRVLVVILVLLRRK